MGNYNTDIQLWQNLRESVAEDEYLIVSNGTVWRCRDPRRRGDPVGQFDGSAAAERVLADAGWVKVGASWVRGK